MKLLVRKFLFPFDVDKTMDVLFEIPQIGELFEKGYIYDGEITPPKDLPMYVPSELIFENLPRNNKNYYLVLTSVDLMGVASRIHGIGYSYGKDYGGRAIMSNDSFREGNKNEIFNPRDISFQAITLHEVGHMLNLQHHESDESNPCAMPSGYKVKWRSLEDIRFCDDCYQKVR